jgi:hypothetical protein
MVMEHYLNWFPDKEIGNSVDNIVTNQKQAHQSLKLYYKYEQWKGAYQTYKQ